MAGLYWVLALLTGGLFVYWAARRSPIATVPDTARSAIAAAASSTPALGVQAFPAQVVGKARDPVQTGVLVERPTPDEAPVPAIFIVEARVRPPSAAPPVRATFGTRIPSPQAPSNGVAALPATTVRLDRQSAPKPPPRAC
jgi:hypothetical protein